MHPPPRSPIHLSPPPPSSIHLHPSHFNLHPAPSTSNQPISASTSSLQHPPQYWNQNIARAWAIFPNLSHKIQSCPFWMRIGSHGILEVLIPNLDLDFWNSDPQNLFLGKFGPKKIKLSALSENRHTWYLKDADFYSNISFLKFWSQSPFLSKFGPKKSKLSVLSENWHTWYLKNADSYSNISFLKFWPQHLFSANLDQKRQICSFCLKIDTHGISRMRIRIPEFWISKPQSIFGQS